MKLIKLSLNREELLQALGTLSLIRQKRFGLVPVWLKFDVEEASLTIQEERGHACATVPAQGNWPSTGATVDLAYLRGAVRRVGRPVVELIMLADAILVPRHKGFVRLGLLDFGDKGVSRAPKASQAPIVKTPDDLPLFRWAILKRGKPQR